MKNRYGPSERGAKIGVTIAAIIEFKATRHNSIWTYKKPFVKRQFSILALNIFAPPQIA
jgi:hypothetical protein